MAKQLLASNAHTISAIAQIGMHGAGSLEDGALNGAHRAILGLNVDYLLAHRVAPIGVSAGRLVLGMRDLGDSDAISAAAFVTGLAIDPVAIGERDWADWHRQLAAASPPDDTTTVVLRLGKRSVHASIAERYEQTFDFSDPDGWSRLAERVGPGPMVSVIVSREAAWTVVLPTVSAGRRETRRLLSRRSPLRIEQAAWSTPVRDGAAVRVSVVHKDWLDERLGGIRRSLAPRTMTTIDEVGGVFHRPFERRSVVAIAALAACGLALALGVLAIGNSRDGSPAPDASPGASAVPPAPSPGSGDAMPEPRVSPAPPAVSSNAEADAFELVGIAGRLPDDAVALIRPAWGKTVTLRVGDSLLGWRVGSIAPDRVMLAKGAATKELVLKAAPKT